VIGTVEHRVAGQTLLLLPERAAFWKERQTMLVADVHFGKAAAFRSASLPIPAGTTSFAIARLQLLVEAVEPKRIVFLGDLWHAKTGRTDQVISEVARWRGSLPSVEMVLVEGNHDRKSGKLPEDLAIEERTDPWVDGPFVHRHEPEPHPGGYVLAGHIHPCVELVGRANQSARLPCFLFRRDFAILPAFGEFTGCAEVAPRAQDDVFVIASGAVMAVGKTANAR
jgi:uncharacterized protein